MIDKANVGGLRKLLGTRSDSETVRAAVQHRLASLQTRESPGMRHSESAGRIGDLPVEVACHNHTTHSAVMTYAQWEFNPRTGTFLELPQKRDTHDFISVPVLGEF